LADRRVGGVRKGTRGTGGRRDKRRVCRRKKKIEVFVRLWWFVGEFFAIQD
jgi:hypothetical protein